VNESSDNIGAMVLTSCAERSIVKIKTDKTTAIIEKEYIFPIVFCCL
jgi:hypothetical protein